MVLHSCEWCDNSFAPRTNGGKPQRFCSAHCRRDLEHSLRAWAQKQLAEGRVTVAELQRPRCSSARVEDGVDD